MSTLQIARICHWLRLDSVAYWLNRGRKRVITFHNVLSDDVFVKDIANGVSCSFTNFQNTIDCIAKRFKFSLDLSDANSVTITFDDGYANQALVAAPYLISKGIPAYLFVSGQLLNISNGELTIDKLLHWISHAPIGNYTIEVGNESISFELNESNRQYIWSNVIWPTYINDAASKGQSLLNALDAVYPYQSIKDNLSEAYKAQRLVGMTHNQIEILKTYGWHIGWHTYSHFPLSKLDSAEKLHELTPMRECDSTVMSFPYGGANEVDKECIEIVKTLGFRQVLSNVNTHTNLSGRFFSSRMSLSSHPILIDFELSGLKYLLKYRKLLPKI
ncbi:MAG: polysaccharide deacetylase family protein [Muribaculum sp.]|nr:polysaccharide deacetylase family protein [Muribaculum sp.]